MNRRNLEETKYVMKGLLCHYTLEEIAILIGKKTNTVWRWSAGLNACSKGELFFLKEELRKATEKYNETYKTV